MGSQLARTTRGATPRLLLVEDDEVLRGRLARALAERGIDVTAAANAEAALRSARTLRPDYAVIDLKLPDESGLEVLRQVRELAPACAAIMLTGYGSIATAVEAVRSGAVNFLPKPADADEIWAALTRGTEPERQPAPDVGSPPAPSLDRAEWEHIQRVLADCSGNISEAARRLGIHRRSLQRKLQKPPLR